MKYVVVVRGKLKGSATLVGKVHDEIVSKVSPMGKSMGNISHQAYLNVQDGGDFLAIDFWDNMEGIQKLYSDPNLATEFARMFAGQPEVTIWSDSGWVQF